VCPGYARQIERSRVPSVLPTGMDVMQLERCIMVAQSIMYNPMYIEWLETLQRLLLVDSHCAVVILYILSGW